MVYITADHDGRDYWVELRIPGGLQAHAIWYANGVPRYVYVTERRRQLVCHDVPDRPHRMLVQPAADHGGFDCIDAQIRCPQLGNEPATKRLSAE